MKVIIDADSLIYAASFSCEDIDSAMDYFNEKLEAILDVLSNDIDVSDVLICNGSINCFRKSVNASYKLNRNKEKPEILSELHNEVKLAYNSYWADGVETDDVVATLWRKEVEENGVDSVVIAANDKDYRQFPCWLFNTHYSKMTLEKIGDFDACKNFYTQMIVGDSADNVNYIKGKGVAYARKLFENIETKFGLFRKTYYLYKDVYGDEAKEKFLECYKLLKLRTDSEDLIRN